MSSWEVINPNALLPGGIAEGAAALVAGVRALAATLDTLTLALPVVPPTPNPGTAVAAALVRAVTQLLDGSRVHVLVVPIAKISGRPASAALPSTVQDLEAMMDVSLGARDAARDDAYAGLLHRTGGSAGFYASFAEALMDPNDLNRPAYDHQQDAVTMTTLMVGAASYVSMVSAVTALETLLRPSGGNGGLIARTHPTPQGLRARTVATSSGQGIGVRIDWEAPKAVYQPGAFPGLVFKVTRFALIRTTDKRILDARRVLDLFPTPALTEGMVQGPYQVVDVGTGANTAAFDTPDDLMVPTYYTCAWEVTVREHGRETVLPFDRLSNVVKVVPRAPTVRPTGRAPNWHATPSPLGVFPVVARTAQRLIAQADVFLTGGRTPDDRVAQGAAQLQAVSAQVAASAEVLVEQVTRLAAALARAAPSLYVTQMSSATGGNAYLLTELARRLGDRTDPTRPPFDGAEYVCGVCLVAGAPRLADLEATMGLLGTLFGAPDAANPLLGVLDAIDTLVLQAEAAVLGPDLRPLPPGTPSADVNPATGLPARPATPTFADDGTPITGDAPTNPAAGATGRVALVDLC